MYAFALIHQLPPRQLAPEHGETTERSLLLGEAEPDERVQTERSVSDPRESVVPTRSALRLLTRMSELTSSAARRHAREGRK